MVNLYPSTAPKLVLDDYGELLAQALDRLALLSDGLITDRSKANAAYPFLASFAFAGAELLYAANKAAPLTAHSIVSLLTGVNQIVAKKAQTTIQFQLVQAQPNPYTIPAGFAVFDPTTNLTFYTDTTLVIGGFNVVGQVSATAAEPGTRYNLPPGVVTRSVVALSNLSAVTNITPAIGGTDPEDGSDYATRLRDSIRNKTLISAYDYVSTTKTLLGGSTQVKLIPNLSSNKLNNDERGSVHLFIYPGNNLDYLAGQLRPNLPVGTTLYISEADTIDVDIEVVAKLTSTAAFDVVSTELYSKLTQLINPGAIPIGEPLINQRLLATLAELDGIDYIEAVQINDSFNSLAMPNAYTSPILRSVVLYLSDDINVYQPVYLPGI